MTIQSLEIPNYPKCAFLRFPQTKILDLVFVILDPLSFLSIFVQPENKNTNNQNVEKHAMGFDQYLTVES